MRCARSLCLRCCLRFGLALALPSVFALTLSSSAPALAAPPHDAAWTQLPAASLGFDGWFRRKWRDLSVTLRYRTRVDRLITAARLKLQPGQAKLDGVTGLQVRLNGVQLGELSGDELREAQPRELPIDPRLLTTDNEITLTLLGPRRCVPAGVWSVLGPESALEVREARLRGPADLEALPLPFFDPQLDGDAEVPIVFARSPSPAEVRAAFVLAGAFALAAPGRVRFPVHIGALPDGQAVVLGDRDKLAELGLSAEAGQGLVDSPVARNARLLVVPGAEDELLRAAGELAQRLRSRAPLHAVQLGSLVSFSQLARPEELIVRGRRDGEVALTFSLPPASVFWRDAGLPVNLRFEELAQPDAPPARLVVLLNGEFVATLKHTRRHGQREARFRLPQQLLRRHNRLTISRELDPVEACPAPHLEERFVVLGESTLDLRRASQIATLPDLGQLGASGFPFSRSEDLDGTAVLVPDDASPRTLSLLLGLAGKLARLAGQPAFRAVFLGANAAATGLDRDLIVVGAPSEQPLLEQAAEAAPARFADGNLELRHGSFVERTFGETLKGLLEQLGADELSGSLQLASLGPPSRFGVIESFESPLKRGRTVLALTAASESALPDASALDWLPAPSQRSADLLVVADGQGGPKTATFARADRYVVGKMGTLQRTLWYLSLRPWLIVLFLVLGAFWVARAVIGGASGRARRRLELLALLFLVAARPARAEEPAPAAADGQAHAEAPLSAQLEARARFWEAQGRAEKAAEVWQQLLRLDPESEVARAGLSRCRGPQRAAREADAAVDKSVAGARALAAAGKYEEAARAYRKALGAHPPDRLALEYWETLAGTSDGRAEAEAALLQLVREHPNAPELQLAHARALTYDEHSRQAGMAELEKLTQVPQVARDAKAALERARSWAASGVPASIHGGLLKEAYVLLNSGKPDEAAQAFERALQAAPRDPEALVGLAWVRVKEQRFADARALAERAQKAAPGRRALWQEPLRVASLWSALELADQAAARHDWALAADALTQALKASPDDATRIAARRGELLVKQGRFAEAESALRPLVESAPYEVLPPLLEAMLAQGKNREADELAQAQLGARSLTDADARKLRVAIARAQARSASARGDDAAALKRLREAVELDPTDRALPITLVYRELGADETEVALARAERLRKERPEDPEVLAALAAAQAQDGWPKDALRTLEAVPAARLSRDARALRDQLAFAARTREALAQKAQKRQRTLEELESEAGLDAEWLAIVAEAWTQADQKSRALALVRKARALDPGRGARLRLCGILAQLGSAGESELERLLEALDAEGDLTTREKHVIARARAGLLIRRVDADRRAGEYRRAFLRLQPALEAAPDDAALLSALARLQATAGHARAALTTYRRLLDREPGDFALREGAAYAAVESGRREEAGALAQAGLQLAPEDPKAYLLAGRIAVARGDDHGAHQYFALGLERWRKLPEALENKDEPDPSSTGTLLADARAQLLGEEELPEPENEDQAAGAVAPGRALREEQTRLELRYAPTAGGGLTFRFRSGDPGTSRLFEVDLPLTLQLSPRGQFGRFTARVVPVYVTSQTTDLNDINVAEVFGTNPVFDPPTLGRRLSNNTWGVALSLRYDFRGFFGELASTPIGFHVVDAIGQAGWSGSFGSWSFGLRGFREPVIDSVLSFGGLRDPRSGIVWGGVRREGGQLDLGYDPGEYVVHFYASYAAYTGQRVDTNHGGQYDLTGLWRLYRRPRQNVALGLNLFIAHFADNLRYFTLGQGGYFSPQIFLFAGVPLQWELHADGWTLQASAEVGLNWYEEHPTPLFPNDGLLQSIREQQAQGGGALPITGFSGVEKTSAFGRIHVSLSHDLPAHFSVLGTFDGQFAPAYSEILLLLALRKVFL